jgi:hypothetical protein
MHTFENAFPQESNGHLMNDLVALGDELTDDDLLMAVGGLMMVDIEVVSYIDGKVVDHQIDIFYV